MSALLLLAALAAGAQESSTPTARAFDPLRPKQYLSYFLQDEGGCDWRLLRLEDHRLSRPHRAPRCPKRLMWLGTAAYLTDGESLWLGDWTQGRLEKLPPPHPLPYRGSVEAIGFDRTGAPVAVVADEILEGERDRGGGLIGATHSVEASSWTGKGWSLVYGERVRMGPKSAPGLDPVLRQVEWTGRGAFDVRKEMAPGKDPVYLVSKDGKFWAKQGKAELYMMPSVHGRSILDERWIMTGARRDDYYAVVPLEFPVQGFKLMPELMGPFLPEPLKGLAGKTVFPTKFLVARVTESVGWYSTPVHGVEVEKQWLLRPVDDQFRPTPPLAIDQSRGHFLIVGADGLKWPKLYRNSDFTVVLDEPNGHGALLFP